MKPIIILPPGAMSDENIAMLRANELCVVVAEKPEAVKFIDPLPAMSSRSQIEHAAIQLSRRLLNGQIGSFSFPVGQHFIAKLFAEILVEGTPLQAGMTDEEKLARDQKFAGQMKEPKITHRSTQRKASQPPKEKQAP